MKFLVLLLFAGASLALEDDKIVGEHEECIPHSQPWQVSLNSGYHFCSGSLINQNWVVSAAHCSKSRIEVRLGEHYLNIDEGHEQFIASSRAIIHPNYDSWNMANDIMLIKLSRPATLNSYVQPVALPKSFPPVGTQCTVSGWGNTWSPTTYRNKIQCQEVLIYSESNCKYYFPGMSTNGEFCAGSLEGCKSCPGDSGSPLVCSGELQGIVPYNYGCLETNCLRVYVKSIALKKSRWGGEAFSEVEVKGIKTCIEVNKVYSYGKKKIRHQHHIGGKELLT
ncbi:trypsin-2-like [Neoarius graeffei]|uniref:trypsin-2-like n=1 Tax=Neoarius graeffei TaxID=443677 RepID=UPI00298D33A1|nr:trypsin-2-like [Neoarius graeffei]